MSWEDSRFLDIMEKGVGANAEQQKSSPKSPEWASPLFQEETQTRERLPRIPKQDNRARARRPGPRN